MLQSRFLAVICLAIPLWVPVSSCHSSPDQGIHFEIENPSTLNRKDALVVLTRAMITQKLNGREAPYYKVLTGDRSVVVQFDDLDKDGNWDELAFLHDFNAGQTIQFILEPLKTMDAGEGKQRAHVRHKRKLDDGHFGPSLLSDSIDGTQQATDFFKQKLPPFLTEGPAWENDLVGFRLYFDVRNGKDIWGKLTPEMVLDQVGTDTLGSYHQLNSWGMDLLKVGGSLGAGALALFVPALDGKDSLVRVGGAAVAQTSYESIADGPIRAIFRMQYKNWTIHPSLSPISITEEIQIWGGQLFYESRITGQSLPHGAQLVTGIVNLHDLPKKEIYQENGSGVFTHGIQSENKDHLGMAILLSKKDLAEFGESPNAGTDVRNTYLVKMTTQEAQPVQYRFYAAWEKSHPALAKAENFEAFLSNELQFLVQPLIIR